jgi:hypothetical protein
MFSSSTCSWASLEWILWISDLIRPTLDSYTSLHECIYINTAHTPILYTHTHSHTPDPCEVVVFVLTPKHSAVTAYGLVAVRAEVVEGGFVVGADVKRLAGLLLRACVYKRESTIYILSHTLTRSHHSLTLTLTLSLIYILSHTHTHKLTFFLLAFRRSSSEYTSSMKRAFTRLCVDRAVLQ